MNGCSRFAEEISAFRDGELAGDERIAFDAHLAGCEPCLRALAALERLDAELRALPRAVPSPDFEQRFWERIDQLEAHPRRSEERSAQRGWLEALRSNVLGPMRPPADWLVPAGVAVALAVALLVWVPRMQDRTPVDRDWLLAADAESFELVLAEDPELLHDLELLEIWDGLEEI